VRHIEQIGRDPSRVAVAALFAVTATVFLTALPAYLDVWRAQPYTHGYLIAMATVWLVWRERDVFRRRAAIWPLMLAVLAGASLTWLVATILVARAVVLALVPILLLLWSAAVLGPEALRRLAPIAAIFLLAAPVWEGITPALQWMTITFSSTVQALVHIPATIDGDIVRTPHGSFQIAGGCAGLSYLLSGLTVGALYAHAFLRRWPTRAAVVALAAALSILSNWTRVSTLIVIGHLTNMQARVVQGSLAHITYGWGVFVLSLLVFFSLGRLLDKWEERRWPPGPAVDDRVARAPSVGAVRPGCYATIAALIGPLLYVSVGALPVREVTPLVATGGTQAWHRIESQGVRAYGWEPAFQGADQHIQGAWTKGSDAVFLDQLEYRHQTQGSELIGYRSRIAPDTAVTARRLSGPVGTERRLVNEAIIRDGDTSLLVWYWYRVGGVEAVEPARAKLLEVWAFFSRFKVSELIAFSTPCAPGSCA
jgi:EpsI family protein